MTNIYDKTIRKWIHRFNDYGEGIFTQMDYSGMTKITDKASNEILHISSTSRREIGLKFSTWSLGSIARYVKEKKQIKDGISHTAIRDILIEYGLECKHSKTVLGKSKNPVLL
jgi:transposase